MISSSSDWGGEIWEEFVVTWWRIFFLMCECEQFLKNWLSVLEKWASGLRRNSLMSVLPNLCSYDPWCCGVLACVWRGSVRFENAVLKCCLIAVVALVCTNSAPLCPRRGYSVGNWSLALRVLESSESAWSVFKFHSPMCLLLIERAQRYDVLASVSISVAWCDVLVHM